MLEIYFCREFLITNIMINPFRDTSFFAFSSLDLSSLGRFVSTIYIERYANFWQNFYVDNNLYFGDLIRPDIFY